MKPSKQRLKRTCLRSSLEFFSSKQRLKSRCALGRAAAGLTSTLPPYVYKVRVRQFASLASAPSRLYSTPLAACSVAGFSIIQSTTNRMKPGEKEVNTLLRNEASCLFFFKPPIRSRSPLLTGSRLISLPLATQMFQFAKFEKSKERRLATERRIRFPDRRSMDHRRYLPMAFRL